MKVELKEIYENSVIIELSKEEAEVLRDVLGKTNKLFVLYNTLDNVLKGEV